MEEAGTARAHICTHVGVEGGDVLAVKGGGVCIVSPECGGRACLVAFLPRAPDGRIIDAHPSSRAAGATGRVQCDGVGRHWNARGREGLTINQH